MLHSFEKWKLIYILDDGLKNENWYILDDGGYWKSIIWDFWMSLNIMICIAIFWTWGVIMYFPKSKNKRWNKLLVLNENYYILIHNVWVQTKFELNVIIICIGDHWDALIISIVYVEWHRPFHQNVIFVV